eukprot:CAMPEP_0202455490 /NCGR_PEP_ID=MMETSP1360-20130828/13012_1 /ASSEMBLY_ACC=CAM_ASM_000848 /TAXON_ID=515479 /ORGANISM="Licmophora paradoxa, Strain CCMP2313" /LENGTH=732 /DNA_ID=CAMNT_0049075085 /DNA_START=23 /DNA_END=2221 /DNA_ORIENTATION=+
MSATTASIEDILGPKIVTNTGEEIETTSLSSKKQIIIYFSAHWCPPCRNFTPKLAKAYKEYIEGSEKDHNETTVIFCSWDNSDEEFSEYHKEMTFPALPFDPSKNQELGEKFGVEGIPSMVAIDAVTGEEIFTDDKAVDLRALVATHGSTAFPLSPDHIIKLKEQAEAKTKAVLKDIDSGSIEVAVIEKLSEQEKPLTDVLSQHEYVGLLIGDGNHAFMSDFFQQASSTMLETNEKNGEGCFKLVYVGWALEDEESDHSKCSTHFPYSIPNISDGLQSALRDLAGEEVHSPMLFILHRSKGLCKLDGTCESAGLHLLGDPMEVLMRFYRHGVEAFPWDATSESILEARKEARINELKNKLPNLEFLKKCDGDSVLMKKDQSIPVDDFLSSVGDDGVIGLYFSAHWCPPCRMFTPMLLECLEEVKGAGKKFEIIFCSSDKNKEEFDEYFESMITSNGVGFYALHYNERALKSDLSEMFGVDGIPTLILMKPDGTIISDDGRNALGVGAKYFPWDSEALERLKKDQTEAELKLLEKEKEITEEQRRKGLPVVERLKGEPGSVELDLSTKVLTFAEQNFSTVGNRDLLTKSGVLYYELEIIDMTDGLIQVGCSLEDGVEVCNERSADGVGDDEKSWAVDGVRVAKWHGDDIEWESAKEWKVGDVIGFAANIDMGKLAVSINGSWEPANGLGVVFVDDAIKAGVYPCITAGEFKLKYSFEGENMKYGAPSDGVWEA